MAMRQKSKATSWRYDGVKGKKFSKKLANFHERKEAKDLILSYKKNSY